MPTLREIYEGQSNWVFGTNYTKVQPDKDTFIEQELSGIRVKSAVDLNNPLIYGNEAIRIANRSTSSVEKMKAATGGEGGDGGLIGKGLGAITGGKFGQFVFGGKVTSLNQARDGVNSKLGIPGNPIPTFVNNTGELQKGIEPNTMITLSKIKNDANGTEFGKFLKQTGGGNFRTIGRNILGQGISLVKDKLRTTLFGNPASMGSNTAKPSNGGYEYSSISTYSSQTQEVRNNEVSLDNLASTTKEKADELKQKALKDIQSKLPFGKKPEVKNLSNENKYSSVNLNKTVENSKESSLGTTSPEKQNLLKQKALDEKTAKLPLGETAEDTSTTEESTYSGKVKQQELDDLTEGTFSRVDLSILPGRNITRKPTLLKSNDKPLNEIQNQYDSENNFSSTKSWTLESIGLGTRGDFINTAGVPENGEYKDIDGTTKTKSEMEALDLVPFWVSGLDSSTPVFFRTVISGFSETVSPSWSGNKFVGNPYNYYTYSGVERSCSFNLSLFCMNEYELIKNWERITFLTSKAYPTIKNNLMNPPFIKFRLGDIYNNKTGYIESLTYTLPDNNVWEIDSEGFRLPKFIDVAITIKFVEVPGSELSLYSYNKSAEARAQVKEQINQNQQSVSTSPVTGGGGEPAQVNVDKTGQVTDKQPEEEKSSQGSSKGVTNINTGKKESTPQQKNETSSDSTTQVVISSGINETTDSSYGQISRVISDPAGAKSLSKRYSTPSKELIQLKKEKENVFYVKEKIKSKDTELEWAYRPNTVYGMYPGGSTTIWYYTNWNKYLKEENKKVEEDSYEGLFV